MRYRCIINHIIILIKWSTENYTKLSSSLTHPVPIPGKEKVNLYSKKLVINQKKVLLEVAPCYLNFEQGQSDALM